MKKKNTNKQALKLVVLLLVFWQCKKKTMQEYPEYIELHQHQGSENYEIATIAERAHIADYIKIDRLQKLLCVKSYINKKETKNTEGRSYKIDSLGRITLWNNRYHILDDATMRNSRGYYNWVIDGDKRMHAYKDPLTMEEKRNWDKYSKKFKQLYNNAVTVYKHIGRYYFNIKGEWFLVKDTLRSEERPDNFRSQFPEKCEFPRMVAIEDGTPDLWRGEGRQKKDLLEFVAYQQVESEKGSGINPIGYSAGYYFFNLHMPGGDTIKIKRFGSMGWNMKLYQIPPQYGGRN
ncbi:MAG: hypothetical protein OIF50_00020, partial [Flavobacteriaceae bacterium]|nr:hypothetical protein [Flavobacteriaceae bacterium]